jgi:quercetin dioxygenase-like cupin family protein
LKEIDMLDRRYKHLTRLPVILAASLQLSTLLPSSAIAQSAPAGEPRDTGGAETITPLPDLTTTTAGEPLLYLSTPNPVISSDILTVPPGGVSHWMTHPVPAYVYVLQGDLTVEFIDGTEKTFHEGEVILQPRAAWHRGRNKGQRPLRFLAVFLGAKGVPGILHPPSGPLAAK